MTIYSFPAGYINSKARDAARYIPYNGFGSYLGLGGSSGGSSGGGAFGAINLKTAGNFVILAKSAVTNVTTSAITGDIGLSPAAASNITGLALVLDGSGQFATAAQVTGKVYAADYAVPTPGRLTTAVLDMQNAYTDGNSRLANFTNEGGGTIGGLTLAPGVHKWTTGVNIATNLTLSGLPTSVFIMQITGGLALTGGANIVLAGGVKAENVFWVVAGATSVGAASLFNGIILDQTSITMVTGSRLVSGRLLAQTAVNLQQNPAITASPFVSVGGGRVPARFGKNYAFMPG